jgi:hypothetical protein
MDERDYKAMNRDLNPPSCLGAVSGSLPSTDELQPFLYWVFHKADRIWVEHTLGWRENAIQEMYEAYLRRKQ